MERGRIRKRAALTLTVLALAAVVPANALATSAGQPFPSNLYTQPDTTQKTGLRIDLPLPNCVTNPSDCPDASVLDTLDAFNTQPRTPIPSSGAPDLRPAPGPPYSLA